MHIGILHYPAAITHSDLVDALQQGFDQEVSLLWYADTALPDIDAIMIPAPGVFSEALRELKQSPLWRKIQQYAQQGGFLFGSGDAFSLLCEFGLLPGRFLPNAGQQYLSKNLHIKVDNRNTRISALYNDNYPLKLPVSTSHGRYEVTSDELKTMQENKQVIFRFATHNGEFLHEANPLGTTQGIAGISNRNRNVFGMIPFPERAVDDELGNTDGQLIFRSVIHMVGRSISMKLK